MADAVPGLVMAAERPTPPRNAETFARAVILAICTASVSESVGRRTAERCLRALAGGSTARLGFRHPGKADAVDRVWNDRHRLYADYLASADKLAFLSTLPWIGPVTRRSLAAQLGLAASIADERAAA
jgi:hypothetical protein